MQIVIEIDEDIAQGIIDGKEEASRNIVRSFQATIADAIKNGTPLPKGHGRLIDADEAIKTLKSLGNRDYRREKGTIQDAEKMLSYDEYTPTIIEAESEGNA